MIACDINNEHFSFFELIKTSVTHMLKSARSINPSILQIHKNEEFFSNGIFINNFYRNLPRDEQFFHSLKDFNSTINFWRSYKNSIFYDHGNVRLSLKIKKTMQIRWTIKLPRDKNTRMISQSILEFPVLKRSRRSALCPSSRSAIT